MNTSPDLDLDDLGLTTLELVHQLNATFGPTLVADMSGSKDSKAPIRWAKPGTTMRPEFERRLRFAHRIMTMIAAARDTDVTRAWFISSNPRLDEESPIDAIRQGLYRQVSEAANSIATHRANVVAAVEEGSPQVENSPRAAGTELDWANTLGQTGVDREERPPAAATMRDVAYRAGVSIKTVSNVVNGRPRTSAATRERVDAAIHELDYQVNVSARGLRRGRTGMIGLALPELSVPYFAELADAVMTAAEAHGHVLLIEQTGPVGEHEAEVLRGPRRRFTDGLLFSPVGLNPKSHPELDVDYPLVLLGERVFDPRFSHVTMANTEASRAATAHLIARGCRHIAVLGHEPNAAAGTSALRFEGYRQALEEVGFTLDSRLFGETVGHWVRSAGVKAMSQVLDSGAPVDGVFAMNDTLALGALHALRERGLRVPEDVAVIGFDDIDDASYADPPLSSISSGRDEIATRAVDLLIAKINGEDAPPEQVVAQFALVERESTARRRLPAPRLAV